MWRLLLLLFEGSGVTSPALSYGQEWRHDVNDDRRQKRMQHLRGRRLHLLFALRFDVVILYMPPRFNLFSCACTVPTDWYHYSRTSHHGLRLPCVECGKKINEYRQENLHNKLNHYRVSNRRFPVVRQWNYVTRRNNDANFLKISLWIDVARNGSEYSRVLHFTNATYDIHFFVYICII